MRIHIGTSGWSYPHWKSPFYPPDLPAGQMLIFYSEHFSSVEINSVFYRLPSQKALEHWQHSVRDNFVFAVKASRYITHMKKLKAPAETLPPFLERLQSLGNKLGPILFQLPPNWHVNRQRLADFLDALPARYRYSFEFRDPSWHCREVFDLLQAHRAAFCIFDLAGQISPRQVTTDFVYVRLHGPATAYRGRYPTQTLAGWAGAFSTWSRQGKTVFCYFDNDEAGYAAQDAQRLKRMLSG